MSRFCESRRSFVLNLDFIFMDILNDKNKANSLNSKTKKYNNQIQKLIEFWDKSPECELVLKETMNPLVNGISKESYRENSSFLTFLYLFILYLIFYLLYNLLFSYFLFYFSCF